MSLIRRFRAVAALGLCLGLVSLLAALALHADNPPPAAPAAQVVDVQVAWLEDKPHLDVSVTADAKADVKELPLALDLWDAQNLLAWRTVVKVPASGAGQWKGRFPLQNIKEPKKQHRLNVALLHADLGIDFTEDLFFAQVPAALVQGHGVRSLGVFPARKVYFTLRLNGFKGRELRDVPASLTVRDADDNVVFNRQAAIKPSAEPQLAVLDVTPEAAAVGPFKLEVSIENEASGLFFNASLAFAQPNALVPITGMEHGDRTLWFAATGGPPESYRSVELHAPGQEAMYYSPQLMDLHPRDNPRLSYDRAEKHSGRQSLRVEYLPAGDANVWGMQTLPGKPLYLSLWVKGNDSQDQLLVYFEDNINFTLPAWQRRANFSSAVVGTMNFTGWRRFRVPVLGYGQQVSGLKGSTDKVDAPVRIMSFQVKPAPLAKDAPKDQRRTLWIDDLAVETQAPATALLSMELQASDPVGRLTADGKLAVSVGNGHAAELKRGRLTLLAKDAGGNPVWTRTVDLPAPAEGFATVEVPLNELAAKKPAGPVEVEVTYQDPTKAGARVSRGIVFKAAAQAAVVQDFEEPAVFSGYQPGKVGKSRARIVVGGADGKGHALALPVMPKEPDNSVLFHPALPGVVDGVEMMVKGGAKPVTLQVWFIDSGFTGVWLRTFNVFWAEPIHVDWDGWRKVVVPAPPVPHQYGDKRRYFFQQPWYPLNLAVNATIDGVEPREVPVEIYLDDVRVVTHLPDSEQLHGEIIYTDENRIHPPGTPLQVSLTNFAAHPRPLSLTYKLTSYQGHVARSGKLDVSVPAGARQRVTLIDELAPGIYDLEVQGLGPKPLTGCVMVLDAARYFGAEQEELLTNPHLLRRMMNLTTERIYLDWDNSEPVPYLHHSHWFENELKKHREIVQLPKELQPLAAKQKDAAAAAVKNEGAARTARDQVTNAERNEKPAADKLAADLKVLDAAHAEVEAAQKALEPLVKKADESAVKAKDAAATQADTMKKLQQAEANLKAAQQAAPAADKLFQDADKAAKTAEAAVKPAQEAAAAAAKELMTAEAELKKAEDAKDAQAIEQAKKKLEAARKLAADTKTKAEAAKKLADTRRTDADKLKVKAEEARKELEKANNAATVERKAADQAKQQATEATKTADAAKAEKVKAEQRLQAAQKKASDADNLVKNDKTTLEQRVQATAEAVQKAAEAQKELDAARVEAEAATKAYDAARSKYDFTLLPVVGFCADWAGPESAEMLQRGTFMRWIPNMMQVPRNPVDWSLFVREMQREYKGRFDRWVFWENPDLDDSPQGLPPKKYAEMLGTFARWVRLYNPKAKVVLGGLNFSKSLGYLRRIPEVDKLPFEEMHLQMNLGELSPEHADVEGYLDDLNALLKLPETKRAVHITELDWDIGPYLTAMRQAAYHARATLMLDSRGVSDYQFTLINTGFDFDGYGVFYRVAYGNPLELQSHKPIHVPKPSYFALVETRRFLKDWKYVASVSPADRSLADNRAYVYRNAGGDLTVALWRAVDGERTYRLPETWQGVQARDIFGFPVTLDKGLPCTPLPTLVRLPAGYALDQLLHDLRMLRASDGTNPVLLDLHLAEADSKRRAGYESAGKGVPLVRSGQVAGDRKVRETYLQGLESESFTFQAAEAGNVLLRRSWFFESDGQKLHVRLNDGPEQFWDLSKGQGNEPGVRETTLVLRGCKAGTNRVAVRYEKPGNCAGYRVEPLPGDYVSLVRWGVLNTRQTRGEMMLHTSAVGTPLTFGKEKCGNGIGAHATSFIEYPLDGQFGAFEVTVGIDGSTEGRGSVVFRIYVDGKEKASSGLMNGFSKPKTLKVDGLGGAKRLILSVTDAEDGNRDDLANWVDGKLFLKAK